MHVFLAPSGSLCMRRFATSRERGILVDVRGLGVRRGSECEVKRGQVGRARAQKNEAAAVRGVLAPPRERNACTRANRAMRAARCA